MLRDDFPHCFETRSRESHAGRRLSNILIWRGIFVGVSSCDFVDRFSLSITGDPRITRTNTNKRLTVIRALTQSLKPVVSR